MYARVTIMAFKKGTTDEAVRIFERSVLPCARDQKGYRRSYFLADRAADKCVAVTFWESEADAAANEENRYYQEQLVKFMALYTVPPIREGYEVAVENRETASHKEEL
jgi:heme-degrading monooxygenase HmoA